MPMLNLSEYFVSFDFQTRCSGVLLHPSSLPGPHGSGDFGPAAYHFVDWLQSAGQTLWQMLPLNPVGPGNSPYASVSAFACNPLLIALEPLITKGWLAPLPESGLPGFTANQVDYGRVIPWRMAQLRSAWQGFCQHASDDDRLAFGDYCEREQAWLDDYALFMALDQLNNPPGQAFRAWCDWDPAIAQRQARAMTDACAQYAQEIAFWQFVQWCFDDQWRALRSYARSRGIFMIGDLPIFVAHHSADCWARPDLYQLDQQGLPEVVAGVPPDFFSPTGQRWGNPLYRWEVFEKEGFAWWIARLKRQLALADVVRIDHFRGFAGYWEISAACPTAQQGHWVAAPGKALFTAIQNVLGPIPIIAEDLGVITPDVTQLRDAFSYPGMRIVQFAFCDAAKNPFLPHNYPANTVAYTGTHDNDTVIGWWAGATEHERTYARIYLGCDESQLHWGMIRAAMASPANTVIVPLQDVLGLDGQHRMNTPGVLGGWTWRFCRNWVGPDSAKTLAMLSAAFDRASPDHLALPDYPSDRPRP